MDNRMQHAAHIPYLIGFLNGSAKVGMHNGHDPGYTITMIPDRR